MFSKIFTVLAVFAASANLVAATPPACLLGAINTQPSPTDLASICGDASMEVKSHIKSMCGDNTSEAMKAYSAVCREKGHAVAPVHEATALSFTSMHGPSAYPSTIPHKLPKATGTAYATGPVGGAPTGFAPIGTLTKMPMATGTGSFSGPRNGTVVTLPSLPPTTIAGAQATVTAPGSTATASPTGAAGRLELPMAAFGAVALALFL